MDQPRANAWAYAGLFTITLATLMYETLLTRIFSVTMWYHFAFMAVSVALFGMTLGAVLVYLFPRTFTPERALQYMARSALGFAVTLLLSFLTHLVIPFSAPMILGQPLSFTDVYTLVLTYALLAIPFTCSGICVCLAMTKFPRQVSRLYAADLAGAALGCIALIGVLKLTDGPTAVIIAAVLAGLGALLLAVAARAKRLVTIALLSALLLAVLAATNIAAVERGIVPPLRLTWVKGFYEPPPLYEKWNSFSRIRVDGDPNALAKPFGWGLSHTYPADRQVRQLAMNIDATAGTFMTGYSGRPEEIEFLKYDVTNLVHYIRPRARVLVVGSGGGRDVLAALAFDQQSVLAVEINEEINQAVNGRFGDFTGHLDQDPRVTFVTDEARSYIARSTERFDILQISLIDTWAATASGAFVLSENSLYTVEGWRIFLEHLAPNGVLSVSRWYFRDRPAEMYRLTALAVAALRARGVDEPRKHIMVIRAMTWGEPGTPEGIGTLLVSPDPFSAQDVARIAAVADQMQFDLVLTPDYAADETFAALAEEEDLAGFVARYPLNIAPPTDDSPYFFHMLRFRDLFRPAQWSQGNMSVNLRAVSVLGILLITVVVLSAAGIVVPLLLRTEKGALRGALPLSLYFAGIGLGYMLVEISQMQRLIVFLGHPTYGLSVVLLALLLSSGIGSLLTERVDVTRRPRAAWWRLVLLLGLLLLFGLVTPLVTRALEGAVTPVRIAAALGILAPLGLLMGMAFPLGMKLAAARAPALSPWLWGINGAMSVVASVLAVVIALGASISASFWTGLGCYTVAVGAFLWAGGRRSE